MKQVKFIHLLSAALLSAILLTLSLNPYSLVILMFAGFVPLLWIERKIREQKKSALLLFGLTLLIFLSWNIGSNWWIWNASPEGAIMVNVINSLLMCLPVMLYHFMQFRMNENQAQRVFIFFWIAFEYAHFNWECAWPWLTLGNVFSTVPEWVQWYEYTGVLGGSAWVLYANVKIFQFIQQWNERSVMMRYSKALNLIFFVLFAPVFLSFYLGYEMKFTGKNLNVLVVQPNIDPYKDKFEGMSPMEQTRKMLTLAEQNMDSTIRLVCFPETAVVGSLNEDELNNNTSVQMIRQFVLAHPQCVVLTGADTYKFYSDQTHISSTARLYEKDVYYDAYNTALLIDATNRIQVYHKAKLVPGVENLPYANMFGFIKKLTVDLGGTSGSLGRDSTSKVLFIGKSESEAVAPVICYESVFGEYVSTYVQKGAGLITILTNDGWWGNTPGYKQHFDFARLRAIESRRYIARSANTGISGIIDPKGNVMMKSSWWKEDTLKATVYLNTGETFYVRFGDYLGKAALMLSILYLVMNFRKKKSIKEV